MNPSKNIGFLVQGWPRFWILNSLWPAYFAMSELTTFSTHLVISKENDSFFSHLKYVIAFAILGVSNFRQLWTNIPVLIWKYTTLHILHWTSRINLPLEYWDYQCNNLSQNFVLLCCKISFSFNYHSKNLPNLIRSTLNSSPRRVKFWIIFWSFSW